MKFEPNGKYEWHGVFLDEDGDDRAFVVFADDIKQAVADANMPGEIVALARGHDVSEETFEVDNPVLEQEIADHRERFKKTIN